MTDDVTCPECGDSYDTPRGFLSHWGHADDADHEGPAPKEAYGELESSEDHREKIAEAKEDQEFTDETRRKISETLQGCETWSAGLTKETSESVRKRAESLKGYTRDPEVVEQHAKAVREAWERGAYDDRDTHIMAGEDNPNYRHGKYAGRSGVKYPAEFDRELREKVRERDNRECQHCGASLDGRLHVHHIDTDKENNSMDNLVSLCSSCHKSLEWYPETVQRMTYSVGPNTNWGATERVVN